MSDEEMETWQEATHIKAAGPSGVKPLLTPAGDKPDKVDIGT